ncbi:hypothetical protein PL10110_240047 [Planktothrix agardhii]|nr:hypothetical protein PL10110_240047 [Planktothrix agardhii]
MKAPTLRVPNNIDVIIDIRPAVKRTGIPSISTNQPFDKLRR